VKTSNLELLGLILFIAACGGEGGIQFPTGPSDRDTTQFIPLTELDTGRYKGFMGGLYPGGRDSIPAAHQAPGRVRAARIRSLDLAGRPSTSGKMVLLSIGMSNTTQEFCAPASFGGCGTWTFMGQAAADNAVSHSTLAFVDGARGGQVASTWNSPTAANYDSVRLNRLAARGFTEQQVQIVWLKVANANPLRALSGNQGDAIDLLREIGAIVRALKVRYPNLQQVFLSSRIYAGYATTTLNPEPYAYESGFAVKWAVEAQINEMRDGTIDSRTGSLNYETVAPWIAWGPYLWGAGTKARADGVTWLRGDFESDGTHPSQSGEQKVGKLLLDFFKTSPATSCWFLVGSSC